MQADNPEQLIVQSTIQSNHQYDTIQRIIQDIRQRGWDISQAEHSEELYPTYTPYFAINNGPFENVRIMANRQIATSNTNGINGYVLEIQSDFHGFMFPGTVTEVTSGIQQVYMTVCSAGDKKGLHVHQAKEDNFVCLAGEVEVCLYKQGEFLYIPTGEISGYITIKIPPGVAHGIKNTSNTAEAKVLNCTYPPYDPRHKDQIDLEVEW